MDEALATQAIGAAASIDAMSVKWTKALVLDTETTGLHVRIPGEVVAADDPRQPRMAGISMALFDADGAELKMFDTLIKPDGWTMPQGPHSAGEANGLTDEQLTAEGRPIADVLPIYNAMLDEADFIVAYNAPFDLKIIRGELRRGGLPDRYGEKPVFDVLPTCRTLLKGKLPKGMRCTLKNAHLHFIGEDFEGAHTSLADMRAAHRLFKHICGLNLMVPQRQPMREEEAA